MSNAKQFQDVSAVAKRNYFSAVNFIVIAAYVLVYTLHADLEDLLMEFHIRECEFL